MDAPEWGAIREEELSYIAFLIQNSQVLEVMSDKLEDMVFHYPPAQLILAQLLRRWKQLQVVPTMIELEADVRQAWADRPGTGIEWEEVKQELHDLPNMPVTAITHDRLCTFIALRDIKTLGHRLSGVKEEQLGPVMTKVREDLEDLLAISGANQSLGIFPYSEEVISNPQTFIQDLYGGDPISFGIPKLDVRLRGGMLPGELGIIVASTGLGKTLVMFNIAIHVALTLKKRVIYYALDNPEGECIARIYATTTKNSILKETTDIELSQKIRYELSRAGGPNTRFCLKDYPPETVTVLDLARHVRQVRRFWKTEDVAAGIPEDQAGKLGLIIVDYGDLILPTAHHKEKRHELKSVFDGLMGLAKRERVPVLTATQGNRESLSAATVTMKHLAEAFSKAWVASLVMTLCQTDDERAQNPTPAFRIYVNKARRPDCHYIIPMLIDYETMQIMQDPNQDVRSITGGEVPHREQTSKEKEFAPLPDIYRPKLVKSEYGAGNPKG